MKKSVKLLITGSVQSLFFEQFIKEQALNLNVRGYFRKTDEGKVEIFAEGDHENVDKMVSIAKKGPKYAQIRNVDEKLEKFQDFKDFRIIRI